MISDIFPPDWRATATSVFYIGGAFGTVAAFGGGAWVAAHYGWRTALLLAAVPGLILATLFYLTVKEPIRGLSDGKNKASRKVSARETLRFIYKQRAVTQIVLGLVFLHMVGNGLMAFVASFLIRSHDMSLSEAGSTISLLYFVAAPISQLASGFVADYLGRHDVRWRLRLGPLGSVFCVVAICAMTVVESRTAALALFAAWAMGTGLYQGPLYALLQTMVKPQMRATMGSIQFVLTAAVGGALGPMLVGLISDFLSPQFGTDSLRYALFILGLFYLWAAAHFIFGERHLKTDLARAEKG